MLTVVLLRHAKSSWDQPGADDFARPLAPRGRSAAPLVAEYIAALKLSADVILCSSAVRTRETLAIMLPVLRAGGVVPWDGADGISFEDGLYLATPSTLLARLRRLPGGTRTVMVVGHNPGLHDLAVALAADGLTENLSALARGFPTAAVAVITFPGGQWSHLAVGTGTLSQFMTPRGLKAAPETPVR